MYTYTYTYTHTYIRVLRTWDVKDMTGSRDTQNLQELEMLLMQLPSPVRARLQVCVYVCVSVCVHDR